MANRKTQGFGSALILAMVAACAHDPVPAWRSEAFDATSRYERHFLRGEIRLAQVNYERAIREISSTGDEAQVNIIQLTRCALETSSLDFSSCAFVERLAADRAQTAYLHFLQGEWSGIDVESLPPRYQPLVAAASAPPSLINQILAQINDPLSRLVAAGIAIKRGNYNQATLELAAETASREGWRRPLLSYLSYLKNKLMQNGDMQGAQRLQNRIKLVLDPMGKNSPVPIRKE